MGVTVAVAGASGYAGGELLRLLAAHPEVTLGAICANTAAGRPVSALHPQLISLADRAFVTADPDVLAGADAVLLAVPHGRSAELAAAMPPGLPVIDLGADHRLTDPAQWARYYGGEPAPAWVYGLPELPGQRDRLAGQHRIAAAGCHATAVQLALAPLLSAGLAEPQDLVVTSCTGTSGAGRTAKAEFTSAQIMGDVSAYKVGRHQHSAEILQSFGPGASISFIPVLTPMPRGILAVASARTAASEAELRACLARAYDTEPFVHLLPEGSWPHTAATLGSNSCQLQLTVDDSAGRVVVTAALDNLGKGAAGQGVQCLNLALGLPETMGLSPDGVAP